MAKQKNKRQPRRKTFFLVLAGALLITTFVLYFKSGIFKTTKTSTNDISFKHMSEQANRYQDIIFKAFDRASTAGIQKVCITDGDVRTNIYDLTCSAGTRDFTQELDVTTNVKDVKTSFDKAMQLLEAEGMTIKENSSREAPNTFNDDTGTSEAHDTLTQLFLRAIKDNCEVTLNDIYPKYTDQYNKVSYSVVCKQTLLTNQIGSSQAGNCTKHQDILPQGFSCK